VTLKGSLASGQSPKFYVGLASDVKARLADDNGGAAPTRCPDDRGGFTVAIEFQDEQRVIRFERYLKSGSGRAFSKVHFEP